MEELREAEHYFLHPLCNALPVDNYPCYILYSVAMIVASLLASFIGFRPLLLRSPLRFLVVVYPYRNNIRTNDSSLPLRQYAFITFIVLFSTHNHCLRIVAMGALGRACDYCPSLCQSLLYPPRYHWDGSCACAGGWGCRCMNGWSDRVYRYREVEDRVLLRWE